MSRPLLLVRDPELAEEATRLAAVIGCELELGDAENPARGWRTAPAVILDEQTAVSVAEMGLRRRHSVWIVSRESSGALWRAAFEVGAERTVELPAEERDFAELLAESMAASVPRSGRVLAVLGGCGGAGASVLAVATALASARRGDRCLLMDCDPIGGGLDLTAGTESDAGARWSGLAVSGGRIGAEALREALPERKVGSGALAVLACDREGPASGMTAQAVRAVLDAARRTGETVVCDLPRALPEAAAMAARLADRTVLVIPTEVRSCAAARQVLDDLRELSSGPVCSVVRRTSAGGVTSDDIGRTVGLDVVAVLRGQSGLAAAVDRGGLWPGSRGSLARAADTLLSIVDQDVSAGGSGQIPVPAGAGV